MDVSQHSGDPALAISGHSGVSDPGGSYTEVGQHGGTQTVLNQHGSDFEPAQVVPPSEKNYTIPAGATVCSTQAQLDTALAGGSAIDIKVLNGTYSRASESVPAAGHRIWCETAKGVQFNYGFRFNNNTAWEIHGGVFTIPDLAHAATDGGFTAAILNWTGSNTITAKITDVTLDGANVVTQGIQLGQPGGCTVQRVVATNFTDEGLRASDNSQASAAVITTITDLDIAHIYRASRGGATGTAEAGVWLGHRVSNTVSRIKIRDTGWMGLWCGNICQSTTFTDLDIDTCVNALSTGQVGVYCEHLNRNLLFSNFSVGPNLGAAFNFEWDYNLSVGLSGPITLPLATIPCNESLAAFPTSGTIFIGNPGGTIDTVTYTGISGNSFTGCTGGTHSYVAGDIVSNLSGGDAAWQPTIQNGQCGANRGTPIFFDTGTMKPTVTGVTFLAALTAYAIKDRTNNPQCTNAGNSNLVQSGNNFGSLTPIGYG